MNDHEHRALKTLLGKFCKETMSAPGSACGGDGACDDCPVQAVMDRVPDPAPAHAPMTADRARQIAFQALQLVRQEREKAGHDPVDTDDWLFSELDAEAGEIAEIFGPYGITAYTGSCFKDGESPRDFDLKHFSGKR